MSYLTTSLKRFAHSITFLGSRVNTQTSSRCSHIASICSSASLSRVKGMTFDMLSFQSRNNSEFSKKRLFEISESLGAA